MSTCTCLNIRVGGRVINYLIGSPGFMKMIGWDDGFPFHRSTEFENIICTSEKTDLVETDG